MISDFILPFLNNALQLRQFDGRQSLAMTAAANKSGDVVVVTSYAFLKENGFFEPGGFLTNFAASLPGMIQTLPKT
jgi:hypothetical protein